MIRHHPVIRAFTKICDATLLMIAGAWLLAAYLTHANPALEPALKAVSSGLTLAFWITLFLGGLLRPKEETAALGNPSPRWSGMVVVVATGLAGAIYVAGSLTTSSYIASFAILMGTFMIAALVWRFATTHAAEIGEARFATDRSQ